MDKGVIIGSIDDRNTFLGFGTYLPTPGIASIKRTRNSVKNNRSSRSKCRDRFLFPER